MNIAICAPDAQVRDALSRMVGQYMADHGFAAQIAGYADCAPLRLNAPDAAVVWLVTAAQEALAAARQLREAAVRTELIFASETTAHLPEVSTLRAAGYVPFPAAEGLLRAALDGVALRCGLLKRHYAVHTRSTDRLIPHARIRYFRSEGHYIRICVEGEPEQPACLGRLEDVQRQTAETQYVRCHQRYLVNRRAIARREGAFLVLKSGERLPVSRRYAPQLAEYAARDSDVE